MNRRRLEFESLRDSLLFAVGVLDEQLYGKPTAMFDGEYNHRRSIYGEIDRQDLPNLLRVFDFASPDQSASRRPQTTVPQQALFMMNSPLLLKLAEDAVTALPSMERVDESVTMLFQRVLARNATEAEMSLAREFLSPEKSTGSVDRQRWIQWTQLMLMSNEFVFVD